MKPSKFINELTEIDTIQYALNAISEPDEKHNPDSVSKTITALFDTFSYQFAALMKSTYGYGTINMVIYETGDDYDWLFTWWDGRNHYTINGTHDTANCDYCIPDTVLLHYAFAKDKREFIEKLKGVHHDRTIKKEDIDDLLEWYSK